MDRDWQSRALALCLAALLMFGCGSNDDDDDPIPLDGVLQIVNAIVDSPSLTVNIIDSADEETSGGTLSFQSASSLMTMAGGMYSLNITYEDPITGGDEEFITDYQLEVSRDTVHTVVLWDSFTSPDVLLLEKPIGEVDGDDSEDFEVQFLNLSTGTSLDVHFSDPALSLGSPTTTLSVGGNSEPLLLPADSYRIRVTEPGVDKVLYDSGAIDIPERSRRTVIFTNNVGPDPTTRSAFVATELGTNIFPNEVARSGLRIVNAIADEANVSIEVLDSTSQNLIQAATLDFPDITDFISVDPNFLNVAVEVASNPGVVTSSTVSLNEDTFFTLVIAGSGIADSISIRATSADHRPVATVANLHFINALRTTDIEDFNRVDLYALPIGDSLADAAPKFSQIEFLGSSSSTLPATGFDLVVTTAGTQSILAGPIRLTVEGSTSLLVVAAEGFGGGTPFQIVVHRAE